MPFNTFFAAFGGTAFYAVIKICSNIFIKEVLFARTAGMKPAVRRKYSKKKPKLLFRIEPGGGLVQVD
ncbi:MAG: hypothetical protein ACI3VS_06705, partial [Evtepia sp.]